MWMGGSSSQWQHGGLYLCCSSTSSRSFRSCTWKAKNRRNIANKIQPRNDDTLLPPSGVSFTTPITPFSYYGVLQFSPGACTRYHEKVAWSLTELEACIFAEASPRFGRQSDRRVMSGELYASYGKRSGALSSGREGSTSWIDQYIASRRAHCERATRRSPRGGNVVEVAVERRAGSGGADVGCDVVCDLLSVAHYEPPSSVYRRLSGLPKYRTSGG